MKNGLVECSNGDLFWYKDGQLHRLDGAAVHYSDGNKSWYYHGNYVACVNSQEEFIRYLKLMAFI